MHFSISKVQQIHSKVFLFIFIYFSTINLLAACKGCISIDEHNINKILPKFKAVLVKFDTAYPYGAKHEAFISFAEGAKLSEDIILAEVGVKDYGDKENQPLAERYGIKDKDSLPALRLFVNGNPVPFDYSKDEPWTSESIQSFLRSHTDAYIGLAGCLEEFDKIAFGFVKTENKKGKIKEVEKLVQKLENEAEKTSAEIYVKFMKKIASDGVGFIKQEFERLNKIINNGAVAEKKKQELSERVNILQSFNSPLKDEL